MRQRTLLILLGALLLVTAWRYLVPPPGDPHEPAAARSPVAARKAHPEIQLARLDLASLDAARPSMAARRDPWRFQDPPPRRRLAEPEPIPIPPPRQPAVSPTPALPELTVEYLGSFGPREKRIAVLSDGGRTFNALEGEIIGGRFIVERIGYESVEIRHLGIPGEAPKRLPLRRPQN